MIMNKFIKIVILISLFRANLIAGEANGYLDLKRMTMMAVATGAGYIGWLFANKQLGKQVKKKRQQRSSRKRNKRKSNRNYR